MKKLLPLLFIIILIISCKKETVNVSQIDKQEDLTIDIPDQTEDGKINFDKMREIISKSNKMNIKVFFAISVLHKKYIIQYMNEIEKLSEQEKKVFFDQKRLEFFNLMKYSDEEYYDFMDKNTDKMNIFIKEHKAIEEYLTSIN